MLPMAKNVHWKSERERERGQTYRTKDQTLENPKRKTLTFSCGWRQMKMNKQTIEKERAR